MSGSTVNLATYTDAFCKSSTYEIVVFGTIGVCAKTSVSVPWTMISSDTASSPTAAPTTLLDGYYTNSEYRSDRGVTFCGTFVKANTYKLNACQSIDSYYAYNSVLRVATSTTLYTRTFSDTKCVKLLKTYASTYATGVCVESGVKTSSQITISSKISTDLTLPRVTRT